MRSSTRASDSNDERTTLSWHHRHSRPPRCLRLCRSRRRPARAQRPATPVAAHAPASTRHHYRDDQLPARHHAAAQGISRRTGSSRSRPTPMCSPRSRVTITCSLELVAKELLTAYADDIKGMSPVEWVRFAANFAGERVMKRTAAQTIMQTILDTRQDNEEEGSLFNRGTQVKMLEDREEYMLASVARRLQGKAKEMSPFEAFNAVQDHVLHAAWHTWIASSSRRSSLASTGARTTRRASSSAWCATCTRCRSSRTTRAGSSSTGSCRPTRQGRHPGHQRPVPQAASARRASGRRIRDSGAAAVRRDAASRAHPGRRRRRRAGRDEWRHDRGEVAGSSPNSYSRR